MRRASCKSFGIIVTRFAWIAHRLQSSNKCTRKSSVASCNANRLSAVYRSGSGESSFEISRTYRPKNVARAVSRTFWRATRAQARTIIRTRRAKGILRINRSVVFWNLLISFSANVPGRYLRFFCTKSVRASSHSHVRIRSACVCIVYHRLPFITFTRTSSASSLALRVTRLEIFKFSARRQRPPSRAPPRHFARVRFYSAHLASPRHQRRITACSAPASSARRRETSATVFEFQREIFSAIVSSSPSLSRVASRSRSKPRKRPLAFARAVRARTLNRFPCSRRAIFRRAKHCGVAPRAVSPRTLRSTSETLRSGGE